MEPSKRTSSGNLKPSKLTVEDADVQDRTSRSTCLSYSLPMSDGPNETTSLLTPATAVEEDEGVLDAQLQLSSCGSSDEEVPTRSTCYLIMLALSMLGLQVMWTAEIGQVSTYLVSLGLSKAFTAVVWVAGPLSGMIVQPYVGACSDNCRIKWGRRKPFMIGGAIASIISVMLFVWAAEIVPCVLELFKVQKYSRGAKFGTIVWAVLWFYVLDCSINTLQAGIRAFIVDNAPAHQQEAANAWASRFTGLGNIIGYSFGLSDLVKIMPFLGHRQIRIIGAIASIFIVVTLSASCLYIEEQDPNKFGPSARKDHRWFSFVRRTWEVAHNLPPQVNRVCLAQFFNWIGWFPFLFYFVPFVGQLYTSPKYAANPNMSRDEIDRVEERGTMAGNMAFLAYAISSFISSLIFPILIVPAYERFLPCITPPITPNLSRANLTAVKGSSTALKPGRIPGAATVGPPATMLAPEYVSFLPVEYEHQTSSPVRPRLKPRNSSARVARRLQRRFQIPGLSLRRGWVLSHLLFSLSMALTFIVQTPEGCILIGGLVGIAWSFTMWAPFSIIAGEVAVRNDENRRRIAASERASNHSESHDLVFVPPIPEPSPRTYDGPSSPDPQDDQEDAGNIEAGLVLGLQNVAICAPQFASSLITAIIFRTAEKPRGEPGDDSLAWVLRFGGLAAISATVMTNRVFETADVMPVMDTWVGRALKKVSEKAEEVSIRVGVIWAGSEK